MALGATRGNIAALVLREAAVVFAVGAITGLAGAAAAGRAVESQLFGLRAFDPAVFALMPAALALVVALACSMPALRAARIEPVSALRHD
jgi:ABC-type antimicrobial peptide transport system permease subunit